jgi:hypothetical protein
MKPRPTVPVAITDILQTTEDHILVMVTKTGRAHWVDRDQATFYPGLVVVPDWKASSMLTTNRRGGNYERENI